MAAANTTARPRADTAIPTIASLVILDCNIYNNEKGTAAGKYTILYSYKHGEKRGVGERIILRRRNIDDVL